MKTTVCNEKKGFEVLSYEQLNKIRGGDGTTKDLVKK